MVDLILNNTAVTTNVTLLAPIKTGASAGAAAAWEHEQGREYAAAYSAPAAPERGQEHAAACSAQAAPGHDAAGAGVESDQTSATPAGSRPAGREYEPGAEVMKSHGRHTRGAGADAMGPETGHGVVHDESVTCHTRLEADLEVQLAHTDWDREFVQFFDPPDPPIRVDLRPPGRRAAGRADPPSRRHGFSEVEVPGIGVIPADAVHAMAHTVGTTISRALVDQDTGTLVETSTRTYRPTAAIRRFVQQRDMHCRFPTCARDGAYCDVDHVIPWPEGQTTPANLQLLCRHHHRAKHEGGWQVTMSPDGVCTWTSSTGHTYTTLPGLTDIITDLTITPGPGPF